MNRSFRFAFRCSAVASIIVLSALCVHGESPQSPTGFGSTTQPAPGIVGGNQNAAVAAPANQPAVVPMAQIDDEQVGVAITRGVDFILSNFDHSQLRPLDGETGTVDHAGLEALCVDALLESELATRDPRLKPNEPLMKGILDHLKHEKLDPSGGEAAPVVFAHAMRASALAVFNRPEDHAVLVDDVMWLLRNNRDGAYTFDNNFGQDVIPADGQDPGAMAPPQFQSTSVISSPVVSGPMTGTRSIIPAPVRETPAPRSLAASPRPYLGPTQHYIPPMRTSIIVSPPRVIDRCIPPSRGVFFTRTNGPSSMPTRTPMPIDTNTANVGLYNLSNRAPSERTPVSPSSPDTDPYPWDSTSSELGLLGVSAGADAGIDIPQTYWSAVQNHWLRKETEFGTWSYNDQIWTPSIGPSFAGAWALFVTHDWLGASQHSDAVGKEPYSAGLTQAIKWLESSDNSVTIKDNQTNFVGYNLFVLARLGQASGYKFFGSHDWYRELSARVIPTQWPNGAFGRSLDGYDAIVQTAYTLIFLSSGRHPIFMEKLQFSGSWANRPRDVASVTRFASRELERAFNWEVVPASRDYTDWLDSRVLFIASHDAPNLGPVEHEKLKHFVSAGGLIFTHADNGSAKFNDFVEQTLAPALFPNQVMQDIPADDPIFSNQYPIKSPPKLRGIKDGSRWVLVHSPTDLAHHWQARDEKQSRIAFELAVNLFVYANGNSEPKNRLAAHAAATSQPSP
jgi:hypothetical protein